MAELKLPFSFTPGQDKIPGDQLQVNFDTLRELVQNLNDRVEAFENLEVTGVFDNTGKLSTSLSNVVTMPGTIINTGKLVTDTDGNVTLPAQPAFMVVIAPFSPSTVDSSGASPLIFSTESYDTGGDYNLATGVFTAPKDGVYFFSFHVSAYNKSGSVPSSVSLAISTSQITAVETLDVPWGTGVADQAHTTTVAGMFYLEQNDTAQANLVLGSGTLRLRRCSFSGMLIG